jgi:16S rRNA (cytidine1402-2'-O)-methyltransferase
VVLGLILDRGGARRYPGAVSGTLYVVATPIGSMSDLAPRAREVLATADRIAAEDTRVTRQLLQQLGLPVPRLTSYHDHNEKERAAEIVEFLRAGERVALVSDAGTPLISDPGYRLVNEAWAAGVPVVVIPGPCAAVAALSGAGLPTNVFLFVGFLPRDPGPRAATLRERAHDPATLVLYEAPHRALETLAALEEVLGPRRAALVHNLTKPTEVWRRGTLSSLRSELAQQEVVRGEITLVVEGYGGPPGAADQARVEALIDALVRAGVPVTTVRDVVCEVYDRPRREVYQRALQARDAPTGDPPTSDRPEEP